MMCAGTTRESKLQPHLYEWSSASSGRSGSTGLADAMRVCLYMTAPDLRPVETGALAVCTGHALRSSRKLFARDVQGG
jgi:hypothetical protein